MHCFVDLKTPGVERIELQKLFQRGLRDNPRNLVHLHLLRIPGENIEKGSSRKSDARVANRTFGLVGENRLWIFQLRETEEVFLLQRLFAEYFDRYRLLDFLVKFFVRLFFWNTSLVMGDL